MKPILFNTEMVKAILDGRKTVTRRLVKPQPKGMLLKFIKNLAWFENIYKPIKPRYQVGDILYVRETWCDRWLPDGFLQGADRYGYKADGKPTFGYWGNDKQCKFKVWIPSIHMPKEAARIFLKVTDVRVERLQDITEEQAKLGGASPMTTPNIPGKGRTYIQGFGELWNSTVDKNQIQQYGWNANPYVWVIEFERCEKPEATT